MLKCKYNEDCSNYPHCDRMCGLSHDELIFHMNQQIRDLQQEMRNARWVLKCIEGDVHKAASILYQPPYTPSCPYGYEDCVSDPAYIRWNHPEWWEELGMPTECSKAKEYEEGCSCRYYDDEDK